MVRFGRLDLREIFFRMQSDQEPLFLRSSQGLKHKQFVCYIVLVLNKISQQLETNLSYGAYSICGNSTLCQVSSLEPMGYVAKLWGSQGTQLYQQKFTGIFSWLSSRCLADYVHVFETFDILVVSFICFLSRVWAVLSLVLTSCTKGHLLCSFLQTNMVSLGIPDFKTVVCRYAVLSGQVAPL